MEKYNLPPGVQSVSEITEAPPEMTALETADEIESMPTAPEEIVTQVKDVVASLVETATDAKTLLNVVVEKLAIANPAARPAALEAAARPVVISELRQKLQALGAENELAYHRAKKRDEASEDRAGVLAKMIRELAAPSVEKGGEQLAA